MKTVILSDIDFDTYSSKHSSLLHLDIIHKNYFECRLIVVPCFLSESGYNASLLVNIIPLGVYLKKINSSNNNLLIIPDLRILKSIACSSKLVERGFFHQITTAFHNTNHSLSGLANGQPDVECL
jgi:hypothetical protein